MDFISGEKFIKLADYVFNKPLGDHADYYKLQNTFDLNVINKSINTPIIYSPTYLVEYLFLELKNCDRDIILITHNSDLDVSESLFLKKPQCVKKWYSQNVNYKNKNIFSIPIGLENSIWYTQINKTYKIQEKIKQEKFIKNLVYMNHNINTNVSKRKKPYDVLESKSWVNTRYGLNGHDFDDYLDNIYNHKFVICPEGNGIDTHRTWECLYVNTIPIEKRNINNQFYTDLPICFVDDWEEITETFLENEYIRITNTKWNIEKLNFEYWQKKILYL
jgi:hypothetical protein